MPTLTHRIPGFLRTRATRPCEILARPVPMPTGDMSTLETRPVSVRTRTDALTPERRLVQREALFERLSAAPPGRVVLVCAPAGSGKSVLVRSWADAGGW